MLQTAIQSPRMPGLPSGPTYVAKGPIAAASGSGFSLQVHLKKPASALPGKRQAAWRAVQTVWQVRALFFSPVMRYENVRISRRIADCMFFSEFSDFSITSAICFTTSV